MTKPCILLLIRGQTTTLCIGVVYSLEWVKYKLGKESVRYRGPVIWNFVNRFMNFNARIQKDSFKNILHRVSQNTHDSYERPTFCIFLSIITLYHLINLTLNLFLT